MCPKLLLRVEGLAAFVAATVAFVAIDAPLWLYVLLVLAPDISMLGYLSGPRFGSWTYNAAHTYVGPLALLMVGTLWSLPLVVAVGLVWAAHVGADRALGYGLKLPTGFQETHLGRVGRSSTETSVPGDHEAAD